MKKNIALITGGLSRESIVSYQSAESVMNNIDSTLFDIYKIDLKQDGWFYENELNQLLQVDKADFSIIFNNQKIKFEGVFICIHGTPGEDGKLQGYFDMLQIPYTSCNAATSALTFNKRNTIAVVKMDGINVANSRLLYKDDWENSNSLNHINAILEKLVLPLFVKPNNGGSSIGISKVNNKNELETAILKAFKEDNQIIIEEFIMGNEYTIGVYKQNNQIFTLPITAIISENEFFDYEAKYLGKSKEITPANIEVELKERIEKTAKNIYKILNCAGCVRIDFIYNHNLNKIYMLEVNTIPGLTSASLIPQQVKENNIAIKDFYTNLINEMFIKQ
ncbi:MAG: D-alanine--D-alanine ligase [Sediminibacterium sp.]|nr:D-alanine--D-alanine ligase [Sediminibacterium sp.]